MKHFTPHSVNVKPLTKGHVLPRPIIWRFPNFSRRTRAIKKTGVGAGKGHFSVSPRTSVPRALLQRKPYGPAQTLGGCYAGFLLGFGDFRALLFA